MSPSSDTSKPASILELKAVTKIFNQDIFKKREIALDKLSVSFPEGKCTGFLGHNGAGKTTSIRLILGLIKPNKGQVLFRGSPIERSDRNQIGYMPETNKLPGGLTPKEVLEYHLSLFRQKHLSSAQRKERIQELLNSVGLWEHRNKRVSKLSKGMGRRVAWAQAIAHSPDLVILDEPFSGLDPLGREELHEWIIQLKTAGTSLVLCTHELSAANALCDEINIVNRGKLVFSTNTPLDGQAASSSSMATSLSIIGANKNQLSDWKDSDQLSEWIQLHQKGNILELMFPDYAKALPWLRKCIESGLIIQRFGSTSENRDGELLPYFRKEKS